MSKKSKKETLTNQEAYEEIRKQRDTLPRGSAERVRLTGLMWALFADSHFNKAKP